MIISGDFFQLPPVDRGFDGTLKIFAFEAECWSRLIPKRNMMNFTQVFRQKDQAFVDVLEAMRRGHCSPGHEALLRRCDREVFYEDGVGPVEL